MTGLTLAQIESEIASVADDMPHWVDSSLTERLHALARRIAVEIETDKLRAVSASL